MNQSTEVGGSGLHWDSFLMGASSVLVLLCLAFNVLQAWDESVFWRVHHVPVLATRSELEEVRAIDDLRETGEKLREAVAAYVSQTAQ